MVKRLPAMRETRAQSLSQKDLLEKEMATQSSILAWKIPWVEKPGRLQSMGSQRVGQDWATSLQRIWNFSGTQCTWGSKVEQLVHFLFPTSTASPRVPCSHPAPPHRHRRTASFVLYLSTVCHRIYKPSNFDTQYKKLQTTTKTNKKTPQKNRNYIIASRKKKKMLPRVLRNVTIVKHLGMITEILKCPNKRF